MTAREVHAGEASAPVPVAADLYQRIVLDHSRDPRNFRRLPGANREAVGHNRLCGDKVTVYLRVAGDRIAEASFEGAGCAAGTARGPRRGPGVPVAGPLRNAPLADAAPGHHGPGPGPGHHGTPP
jgi:hypothetical protein